MEKVLITGVTGFVGSHIADLCLDKGVEVFGFKRYHLSKMDNIKHIEDKINWIDCDMTDSKAVSKAINVCKPDKIFHMASQSFVSPSWDHPTLYMNANYSMTVNLMEACLENDINPKILIPGSGEEYGEIFENELPIRESTTLRPVNPYAVTKVAQDLIGYVYFRSYGLNIIRTRAFNHEGPRRDKVFGIPWYAYQIARIEAGKQDRSAVAKRLTSLMGYGPWLPNLSQVVDVSADGNYVKDEASSLEAYQLHMLKIQNLMVDEFGVKARNNDMLGSMSDLAAKLGGSGYAEND